MNLEMLMFLMYAGALGCYGVAGVIMYRMGMHKLLLRGLRKVWRMSKKQRRAKTMQGMFTLLVCLTAAWVGNDRVRAQDSYAEEIEELPEGAAWIELAGNVNADDGLRYVRGDNCAVSAHFEANAAVECILTLDDGTGLSISRCLGEEGGEVDLTLSAPEVLSECLDGYHEIYAGIQSDGQVLAEVRDAFVLDTECPTAEFLVATDAAKQEADPVSGRFYYNADAWVTVRVLDEHYDPGRVFLRRDYASPDQLDYEIAEPNLLGPDLMSGSGFYEDRIDTDGVFQYSIAGSDKAGNPLVPQENQWMKPNGESEIFVRDTLKPEGEILVTDGVEQYYLMHENGFVEFRYPYGRTRPVECCVLVGESENLPVQITATMIGSSGNQSGRVTTEDAADTEVSEMGYGAGLSFDVKDGSSFYISGAMIEDLAGNRTLFPDTEVLHPAIQRSDDEEEAEDSNEGVTGGHGDGGGEYGWIEPQELVDPAPYLPVVDSQVEAMISSEPNPSEEEDTEPEELLIPDFSVRFDNNAVRNEKYFRSGRIATIRLRDDSYSEGRVHIQAEGGVIDEAWTREGEFLVRKVQFTGDGACSFQVYAVDSYGNPVSPMRVDGIATDAFVIDSKKPEVVFKGVVNGSANAKVPMVRVTLSDECADNTKVVFRIRKGDAAETVLPYTETSGGGRRVFELTLPKQDSYYILTCEACDPAGNRTLERVAYSINQKGTAFEIRPQGLSGSRRNSPVSPEIVLHDLDQVTILSAAVNGQEVTVKRDGNSVLFDQLPEADGKYVLTMTTRDSAGHVTYMDPLEFYLDRTPPRLLFSLPEESRVYKTSVEVEIVKEAESDRLEYLTLDGEELSGERIAERDGGYWVTVQTYGKHTLAASMVDEAGNRSGEVTCEVSVIRHNFEDMWGRSGWRLILVIGILLAVLAALVKHHIFNKEKA